MTKDQIIKEQKNLVAKLRREAINLRKSIVDQELEIKKLKLRLMAVAESALEYRKAWEKETEGKEIPF